VQASEGLLTFIPFIFFSIVGYFRSYATFIRHRQSLFLPGKNKTTKTIVVTILISLLIALGVKQTIAADSLYLGKLLH
jgi:hypothetical protein